MDIKDIEAIAEKVGSAVNKTPYNVFDAWHMSENDHSKLLLSLLRFETNREFPILYSFLRRFAHGCGKKISIRPTKVEVFYNKCFVDSQTNKKSFTDGLILMNVNGRVTAFIIENKIYNAPDLGQQLSRYITHVKDDCKVDLDNIWAFYLTADGSKTISIKSYDPNNTNFPTYIGNRFKELTYSEDILRWLKEDILNPRTYPETVTTPVRSYVDFLGTKFSSTNGKYNKAIPVLLKELGLPSDVRKMQLNQIQKLYNFQDEITKLIYELSKDKTQVNVDFDKIETLDNVVRQSIKTIENEAFCRFEEETANILNTRWGEELRKRKIKNTWIVRHRGIGKKGNNGFVQIALTENWGAAHVEWIPINVATMSGNKDYTIELHFEKNKNFADSWRGELEQNKEKLPTGENVNKGTSKLFRYKVDAKKPLASMKDEELHTFLYDLYCHKLKYLFKMLIENYKDYKD